MNTEDLMTDAELDELALTLPLVEAWVTAAKKEIHKALQDGAVFKNAKLESKLGNRQWNADVDILAQLRKFSRLDVVAPRVPLSPTQAEETLGGKVYDKLRSFVVRNPTAPKVVSINGMTEKD